jgi:YqcI/YcgG family
VSFEKIVEKSYCPFAKPSVMGPPITLLTADPETELPRHQDAIAAFFRTAHAKRRDGMVITFQDEKAGVTLDALTTLTRNFFTALTRMFYSVYVPEDPEPDQSWYAAIEGERFFLVSFAPCYPETSSRYTFGDPRTYFLLQPASTFVRHQSAINRVRRRVHESFVEAGRPYDSKLANTKNDMFKTVMPIHPLDRSIAWWAAAE